MPVQEPARVSVVEWTEYIDLGDIIVPLKHNLQATVGLLSPGTVLQLPIVPSIIAVLVSAGVIKDLAT